MVVFIFFFFFQAEDGIRDYKVTGVQTCALPISRAGHEISAGMKLEPKEQLGKYPILREIGSGATSRVYLARDPFADREVAIKVFLFDSHADPHSERMLHKAFVAEASLAGKLNHPHIVDILDAVVEPDHSYL